MSRMINRIFIIAALSFTVVATALCGDTPRLSWKSLESGFAEARQAHKKIMIDVYTDWCGWCKRLDKDTYGNDTVARYLGDRYVIIKLNAESTTKVEFEGTAYTEATLAQAFGVSGYPTIIFFDSNGEPLDKIASYVAPDQFLPILKYFGEDAYKTMKWAEYSKQHTPPPATRSKKR
jgi:thioredoxin-related protein